MAANHIRNKIFLLGYLCVSSVFLVYLKLEVGKTLFYFCTCFHTYEIIKRSVAVRYLYTWLGKTSPDTVPLGFLYLSIPR